MVWIREPFMISFFKVLQNSFKVIYQWYITIENNMQIDTNMQWYYTKIRQLRKNFSLTIDNKFSFDEHIINICKTANEKLEQGNIFLKTLMQHLVNEA